MDLVSKRYSNPCFFMDGMIQTGRFSEFVSGFIDAINTERENRNNWEFFLHKVWEGSYNDFMKDIETNKEIQSMSKKDIEATVQDSMNILHGFNPNEKGGDQVGIV